MYSNQQHGQGPNPTTGIYPQEVRNFSDRDWGISLIANNVIHHIYEQSRGTYGAPRVHAELRLGHGITVGHNAVAMLMKRAGLAGLSGNRTPRRRTRPADTPVDLVDRNFARFEPDQLWVTDITEHPTRQAQGLLRCGAGRVQPPGRRLVDRQHGDLGTGHLRVGNGN